ncbi:MAG: zinc ribbon domain-containing protein [Proteobacteria bacterium]|nr:zinc ribbon domain-containing protein [Desulfobulbaceae bacterium]MBU4153581.1 zinc ribbon domain-containing protein [Pseudomonadota bacterium]MDP2104702.1 zinc ribbon domain-containing protein [Desulfobulbaceae bacterium]
MPIYEYQCLDCNAAFEKILTSSTSTELIICSECKSAKVKKKISATSFRLANTSSNVIPAGALSGCSTKSGFS